MPHPHIRTSRDAPDSHDGGIYAGSRWQPAWEATVGQGEAIVFFPNIFHETQVPEDGNPDCTVATTFQIQLPVPARYLRAFLPTHAMSHLYYEGHCLGLWDSFATLQAPEVVKAVEDAFLVEKSSKGLFAIIDEDSDGYITPDELLAHLNGQTSSVPAGQRFGTPWPRWFFTEDYFYDWRPAADAEGMQLRLEMEQELLHARAEDTHAYLDCSPPDGVVSQAELAAAMVQWHVVHARLRATRSARKHRIETDFAKRYSARRMRNDEL